MSNAKYTDVMKPEDISIAHCWLLFAGFVLPANAPPIQRVEMRKAFFAGFTECFKIVTDLSTTMGEGEAAAVLTRLDNEAKQFFVDMMKAHGPGSVRR